FQSPLKLEKKGAGESYQVRWRITLENTSDITQSGLFNDEKCFPLGLSAAAGVSYGIDPGEAEEFFCEQTIPADEDKLITNVVSGTVAGESSFGSMGIVIVGEPPACIVPNVPYYSQCGQDYSGGACSNRPGDTVCSFGCGPTSEAMLINYHCGGSVTGPSELAQSYGCGRITYGATMDILGSGLSTRSFGAGDAFFAAIFNQLCEGRPVITTVYLDAIGVGHISLIVGVDMVTREVTLNDSYINRLYRSDKPYAKFSFDTYRGWVNTNTYWYWGGPLHPGCSQ
ncbi:unnamed protein product, partial [marine sediment metagenome]